MKSIIIKIKRKCPPPEIKRMERYFCRKAKRKRTPKTGNNLFAEEIEVKT